MGAGEAGEVTFEDLSSSLSHGVLARFDRATGDLEWARLLQQTSSAPDVNLLGTLFRGAEDTLDIRLFASGEVDIAGRAEDLGSGLSWLRTRFDESGAELATDVMLRPTTGGGVQLVVSDLAAAP